MSEIIPITLEDVSSSVMGINIIKAVELSASKYFTGHYQKINRRLNYLISNVS